MLLTYFETLSKLFLYFLNHIKKIFQLLPITIMSINVLQLTLED